MKTRLILAAIAAVIIATTALARIGETEAEIQKRYGRSGETTAAGYKPYSFKGFYILVQFNKTTKESEMEVLMKQDKSAFSDEEIAILMKLNGGEKNWKRVEEYNVLAMKWWLADESICAVYSREDNALLFSSKGAAVASKKNRTSDVEQSLKGF